MLYFENAKENFKAACGWFFKNTSEAEFYHEFAEMIPDRVDVDTLVLAFKIAFKDAERYGQNTVSFIALVPQYIRQCTSPEFAHEFREKYNEEVLGLTQDKLPDEDYGYNEIEPDVIDISNKDRAEVLAALYNASTPVGRGFSDYNPMTWTKETAQWYLNECVIPEADGRIVFKWIFGRPVSCIFKDNIVYVSAYNFDNEYGLAQKAISTCPNIEKTKNYKPEN